VLWSWKDRAVRQRWRPAGRNPQALPLNTYEPELICREQAGSKAGEVLTRSSNASMSAFLSAVRASSSKLETSTVLNWPVLTPSADPSRIIASGQRQDIIAITPNIREDSNPGFAGILIPADSCLGSLGERIRSSCAVLSGPGSLVTAVKERSSGVISITGTARDTGTQAGQTRGSVGPRSADRPLSHRCSSSRIARTSISPYSAAHRSSECTFRASGYQ
jgi:hypothetical protein